MNLSVFDKPNNQCFWHFLYLIKFLILSLEVSTVSDIFLSQSNQQPMASFKLTFVDLFYKNVFVVAIILFVSLNFH